MKMSEEGTVLTNERNLLVGTKETLAGYANIVEIETSNLPPPYHTDEKCLHCAM